MVGLPEYTSAASGPPLRRFRPAQLRPLPLLPGVAAVSPTPTDPAVCTASACCCWTAGSIRDASAFSDATFPPSASCLNSRTASLWSLTAWAR